MTDLPFWERPEVVERFAAREPDKRLMAWLEGRDPGRTRVLEVGCAAGRNVVWLAEQGVDVHAVDASAAMVARTRERITPLLGPEEAARRVRRGRMDDLAAFGAASFALVLALGILHAARSEAEWEAAVAGIALVLAPGGELLLAQFSPRTAPTGVPFRLLPGERNLYEGFEAGSRLLLLEAGELDRRLERHGLVPLSPATTAEVPLEAGVRVTVNGHYRKPADGRDTLER